LSGKDIIPPTPDEADYAGQGGAEAEDIFAREDPFALFADWMAAARKSEPNDPNAMALSTADADGFPDVRMVLLKGVDSDGFVFYTNTQSAKGVQLAENSRAALCFHWKSLRRQVRVRGVVSQVSQEEADAYYASRAREPHRRLGVETEPAAGKPLRAGEGGRRLCGEVQYRRDPASGLLDGFSHRAGPYGVLARSRLPPA